jgi:hypothetical protein
MTIESIERRLAQWERLPLPQPCIDDELSYVWSTSGNTATVTGGWFTTTATTHADIALLMEVAKAARGSQGTTIYAVVKDLTEHGDTDTGECFWCGTDPHPVTDPTEFDCDGARFIRALDALEAAE